MYIDRQAAVSVIAARLSAAARPRLLHVVIERLKLVAPFSSLEDRLFNVHGRRQGGRHSSA